MTATIDTYKTKNQIFKDFIGLTNTALDNFGITGWKVKRMYQNIKSVDLEPFVLVSLTNKKQTGAQYRNIFKTVVNETTKYYRKYNARQEITIRFSATIRNKNTETVEDFDSIDILEILKNYLQSYEGIDALALMGYAQYRATDINQQNFQNDDDNVQFLPFFECTYLYTDEWQSQINNIVKVIEKNRYRV